MKQVLTVVCKLKVTPDNACEFDLLLSAFASACNYINQTVQPQITNKLRIQKLVYQALRQKFGLSANQAIRAIARVASNRKTAKEKGAEVKNFAPTSADFDCRIFSFREKDWTVSLTLISGRKRFSLLVADYQRNLLKSQKPSSAQLVKRRTGGYYIHIQISSDKEETTPDINTLGVDLGRKEIAHTSAGQSYSGKQVQQIRDHFAKQRESLQKKASKGTRSRRRRARQVVKRLSGRERRFQTAINHYISLQIVMYALAHNLTIVLEDLRGIRERANQQQRTKQERRRSNSWAFYQLRKMIEYKSLKFGVPIIFVPPAYSSQGCHRCFHIGIRQGKEFECPNCGYQGDADRNAANFLAVIGAAYVNRPGGPTLACSWPRVRATESSIYSAA